MRRRLHAACARRDGKRKEKKGTAITLSAELARLTPDTRQQAVGRSVATVTAMAVQRAGYAVCEGCIRSRRAQFVVRSWAPSPIRKNSLQQHHPVWWLIIEKVFSYRTSFLAKPPHHGW